MSTINQKEKKNKIPIRRTIIRFGCSGGWRYELGKYCRTCTSVQDNNTYRLNLHGNKTTVTYNTGIEVVKTRILYIQRVVEYHHGMHNTGNQSLSITWNLKYGKEVGLALTINSVKTFNHYNMCSKIEECLRWNYVKEIQIYIYIFLFFFFF